MTATIAPSPTPAPSFELGQRVRYRRTLRRRAHGNRKVWESLDHAWADESSNPEFAGTGIVVGLRSLADGTVEYLGEDGTVFTQTSRFTAVMIVASLRRRPVLVRPENVTPIEADQSPAPS